jgi:hypothetical protein
MPLCEEMHRASYKAFDPSFQSPSRYPTAHNEPPTFRIGRSLTGPAAPIFLRIVDVPQMRARTVLTAEEIGIVRPGNSAATPLYSLPFRIAANSLFESMRLFPVAVRRTGIPAASTFKVEEKPAAPEASSVSCRFRAQ